MFIAILLLKWWIFEMIMYNMLIQIIHILFFVFLRMFCEMLFFYIFNIKNTIDLKSAQ